MNRLVGGAGLDMMKSVARRAANSELNAHPGALARMRQFRMEDWLVAHQISEQYGIAGHLLRDMREHGVGPRWRPRGHRFLYHVADFERWLTAFTEQQQIPP